MLLKLGALPTARMSDSLMRDVKQIGQQGCTVVATIHQPSEAVFTRFDKVLLLETGKIAYYGGWGCTDWNMGGWWQVHWCRFSWALLRQAQKPQK